MTSNSACWCVNFAGMCLWMILTMREIQGYPYQERRPSWYPLYNSNPIKPVNNLAQFPNYYPRLSYPYRFPVMPIFDNTQWQPFIFNPRLQKNNKEPMLNGRWINLGNWMINNRFTGMSNLKFVPSIVIPTMFQQTTSTIQREQDRDMPWMPEHSEVFKETTQAKPNKENSREESTIESVFPCKEKCKEVSKDGDDISRLIEKALQNGELLRPDEWIKQRNVTKEYLSRDTSAERDNWLNLLNSAPVCINSTFCLHAIHYPEVLVNQAIQRNDSLKLLESIDQVSEIGDRVEFDELNDSPFCRSYVRLVYPRSAETMNRRWLYVVNQNNLRQGVRIEVCANEGNACGDLDDYLPGGYKTVCKQKYVYRELVAVDANGTMKKDTFKFPSNCCCHREFAAFHDL